MRERPSNVPWAHAIPAFVPLRPHTVSKLSVLNYGRVTDIHLESDGESVVFPRAPPFSPRGKDLQVLPSPEDTTAVS